MPKGTTYNGLNYGLSQNIILSLILTDASKSFGVPSKMYIFINPGKLPRNISSREDMGLRCNLLSL